MLASVQKCLHQHLWRFKLPGLQLLLKLFIFKRRQNRLFTSNLVDMDSSRLRMILSFHDDVVKWKHSLHYWPFVRGIHRSPVNSLHNGQWRGALMSSLICTWIKGWVNNCEAGDLRCHHAHYDVTVIIPGVATNSTLSIDFVHSTYTNISKLFWTRQIWGIC